LFVDHLNPFFLILLDFEWQKNKINIFKHENSKWRPNLKWTSKRVYWLKLGNFAFFFKIQYMANFLQKNSRFFGSEMF
jgi:hypothetical protein